MRGSRYGKVLGMLSMLVLFVAAAPSSTSPVADAVMQGDKDAVRALLAQGADVNEAQGDGMTALHWAAERGDADVAEILIGAGAEVDRVTRLGAYTPLHLASKSGHGSVVELLVAAGGDANAVTQTGDVTALHFAARGGSTVAVRALLAHGADPNAQESQWGQTPLMFAAVQNRTSAIELLLEHGADPSIPARVLDIREWDRIVSMVRAGEDFEAARRAVAEDPEEDDDDPNTPVSYTQMVGTYGGLTPLLMAARDGHKAAVRTLLEGGADLNEVSAGDGTSALLIATINGHFDLALELLQGGADPTLASEAGATPLYTTLNKQWIPATRHPQPTHYLYQDTSYLTLMEELLKAGADPNVRLKTSLWYTTFGRDHLGVDRMGATPFWRAAHAVDLDAMKLLVEYGADPNIPTKAPPARGGGYGQEDDTDHSGLPPMEPGGPGAYPIHAAAGVGYGQDFVGNDHRHREDGWLPAVRYLVEEHGADVNMRDHNGFNPIHHAAARGDNELIEYLVAEGADVTAVGRRGQTTADMANGPVQRVPPFLSTVRLLEGLGAVNNDNCQSC